MASFNPIYRVLSRRLRFDTDGRPQMVIERSFKSPDDKRAVVIPECDACLIEDVRRKGEDNDGMMNFRRNVMAANMLVYFGLLPGRAVQCKTNGTMVGDFIHKQRICNTTMFLMDGVADLFAQRVQINEQGKCLGGVVFHAPDGTTHSSDIYEESCKIGDI